jgi:hypothetical protein
MEQRQDGWLRHHFAENRDLHLSRLGFPLYSADAHSAVLIHKSIVVKAVIYNQLDILSVHDEPTNTRNGSESKILTVVQNTSVIEEVCTVLNLGDLFVAARLKVG